MDVNIGFASPCVKSGVPQVGQKLRVVWLPLLARMECAAGTPVTVRSEVMTTTPDAKGAPLER